MTNKDLKSFNKIKNEKKMKDYEKGITSDKFKELKSEYKNYTSSNQSRNLKDITRDLEKEMTKNTSKSKDKQVKKAPSKDKKSIENEIKRGTLTDKNNIKIGSKKELDYMVNSNQKIKTANQKILSYVKKKIDKPLREKDRVLER